MSKYLVPVCNTTESVCTRKMDYSSAFFSAYSLRSLS